MNEDRIAMLEHAIADLTAAAAKSRRRERRLVAVITIAFSIMATSWSLIAQQPKTIDQRVTDLEKRFVGIGADDGSTKFTAPFKIVNRAGRVLAAIEEKSTSQVELSVGDDSAGGVVIGVGKSGAGFVSVDAANSNTGVALGQFSGGPMGVRVLAPDGTTVQASLALDPANRGRLQLGAPGSATMEAGIGQSGSGFVSVDAADGSIGAFIGRYRQAPMSVAVMGTGETPSVSIYADKLGGNVRVMNPTGTPVGGLFSEEEGGGLVLTGPAGGHSVVDLGVRNGGGSVRVFSDGGSSTRAAMEADARTGGLVAYDSSGRPAASMSSMPGGSGRIQVSNNGIVLVEAGVTTENTGLVRAGPAGCQTVGALAQPCRIVGNK